MQEVCYCGRRGDVEDREPIWDAAKTKALQCPDCGHLDFLTHLGAQARRLVFEEAQRRYLVRLENVVQPGHGRMRVA